MNEKNLPQVPGFYLARMRGFRWWNLLVWVYGTPPFLKADAWRLDTGNVAKSIDIDEICEFGPSLMEDPPDVEGEREDLK
jgi:hypothetical protein